VTGAEVEAARPAATVVVVRDGVAGLEVLMLRKNSRLAFGGMWVFPGGRVDEHDASGGDLFDEAAARRAAAREAREEAAVVLSPDELVPFAHWTPPLVGSPKRYATWFFLGAAGDEAEVTIDGGEIHDHDWVRPAEVLERRDAGTVELAPPTWVSLHRLTRSRDVEAALAEARAAVFERFVTRIGRSEDGPVAMWHGDAGYESGDPSLPGRRHRLVMGSRWRYERTVG
jgi:8-oxo-dGTP pyrophosphatase MutT (NUDIX family)